jgi:PAS domain S-box-containing protein
VETSALAQNAKIFILHSYHQEYPWTNNENEGFVQTLSRKLNDRNVIFSTEYMDTKRVNLSKEYGEFFFKYLKHKFVGYSPDVIFSTDDNALVFLLQYKKQLFGDVPVVFCGVNDIDIEVNLTRQQYTGVFEKKEVAPNLALLKSINHQPGNIFFLGDGSSTHQAIEQKIKRDIASRFPEHDFTFLANRKLSYLLNHLEKHREGVIILTTIGGIVDEDGAVVPLPRTIASIVGSGKFTIISMEDVYLMEGVLGGYVTSGFAQGKEAAKLTMQILNGHSPSSIPLVVDSPNEYMFNFQQLTMFGLTVSQLPANSVILNKPQSIYEEYKYRIWSSIAFLIIQTFVIFALVKNIYKRKDAESSLQKARDELEQRVIERTSELAKSNDELKIEITQRKTVEQMLANSEERMQLAISAADMGYWDWDIRTDILYFSKRCVTMIGYDYEEFDQSWDNWRLLLHPDDKNIFGENINTFQGEKKSWESEIRLRAKDGNYRWIMAIGKIVDEDAEGRPTRASGIHIDQTRLKTQDQKLASVVNSSPWGMLLYRLDNSGNLIFSGANPTANHILGVDCRDFVGKTIEEAFPLLTRTEIPDIYRRIAKEGGSWMSEQVDYDDVNINGAFEVLAFQIAPNEMAASFLDITERRRNEEEKQLLEEKLRQSQKMEAVGRLAGGVAHDFNNLLMVILGHGQMLLETRDEGDPERYALEEICRAGDRATGLTRQLLAFSRKQVLQPQVLNLNDLVENVAKMLQRMIGEDVELETLLSPDLGRVKADPGQIEQVLLNLAVNARDAMPKGGKLTIETVNAQVDAEHADRGRWVMPPGLYVQLLVSDSGVGMSPNVVRHIFEPFYTTKGAGEGTGLGLSTVYGIVKQSDGHIVVYSESGLGTTFKIYLPRSEAPVNRRADTAIGAPNVPRGTETILLAEDDSEVRAMVARYLSSCGYPVLEAANPDEALGLATHHPGPVALLLTDVVMPGANGPDLAASLRAIRPDTRALFMSGYTDSTIIRHGVLPEGMAFLQKPFSRLALARKVREVLDG